MTAPVTALGYVRVSTEEQHVEMQREGLKRYCAVREWRLAHVYEDLGVSGAAFRKPARAVLMARALAGGIGAVLVWRFDRFSRSVADMVQSLALFDALGIDFVSVTEGLDTSTPIGRMLYTVSAAFAELERGVIRERVQAGVRAARAEGVSWGRQPREIPSKRLAWAHAQMQNGASLRSTAATLGVPRTTLRRHLVATIGEAHV